MGYFNQTGQAASTLPAPSRERIKAALESKNWSYKVDGDGDIAGAWEDGFFWFFLMGEQSEIVQVRGTWDGELAEADLPAAERVTAEWNRDMLWPKVYPRINEEGVLRLHAEHSVDYETGVTDEQLALHLTTAVNSGCRWFEKLNEAFPAAAAASKGE